MEYEGRAGSGKLGQGDVKWGSWRSTIQYVMM